MIVQHPAFPSITHDVDNPEDWVAQGWTLVDKMPQVSTPGESAPMPEVAAPEGSPPPAPMPEVGAPKARSRDKT